MQWIYSLCLEMVQYIANSLLTVFSMDLDYFFRVAPVAKDILSILIAAGWALLMGNLVFQAVRSMVSGLGFEGEDPKLLFTRTFVFAFLLLASQQICEIGLNISAQIIQMLQIPSSVTVTIPDESNFNIGASWLLIIIVGFVVMWQFVKLCFEVAERYVVTAVLVLMAPLAFGLGGSKSTEDIFKGWCRMFASMCLMMVMNIIFLKLLISAMGYVPSGLGVLPWMLLIVGIARVARKIDSVVARIGLNPAITGDGLGRGLPGMVAFAAIRGLGMAVTRSASAASKGSGGAKPHGGHAAGSSSTPPPSPPPSGGGGATPPGGGSGQGGPGRGQSGTHRESERAAYHSLIPDGGAHYGLTVTGIGNNSTKLVEALQDGKLVIALMSKGHFTNGGHFIVLRGITEDGKILVADPASVKRSNQEWELGIVVNEARRGAAAGGPFWVFS